MRGQPKQKGLDLLAMGSYRRPGRGESYYTWEQVGPIQPPSQKLPKDNWNSSPRIRGIPLPPTTVHQSLASKIFCSCCRDCKDPQAMGDSKNPSQTQEHQPSTGSRYQMTTPCPASPDLIELMPPLLRYIQISFSF